MITFRTVQQTDLNLLQDWDRQAHVIASDPESEWDWEKELRQTPSWREQFIAELNGTPIGFVQIIDPKEEETNYWGEVEANLRAIDIWIGEPNNLGRGYGTQMMHLALNHCFSEPEVKAVILDPLASNTKAQRFYRRLGFSFIEKRTLGHDHCHIYRLEREAYTKSQNPTFD